MISNASISDHLVPEVVLLDMSYTLEDVSDHHHGCLVIIPSCIQCLEEVVIQSLENIMPDLEEMFSLNDAKNRLQEFHLALQVVGDDLLEANVQPIPMLVQDHAVNIPVQLLEGEARFILPLNLMKNPFHTSVRQ